MQALHAHSPFVPAQNNSTFSLSVVLHMAMESRIFMLMGGYHGPLKPMHEFILSSSQLSNQDTYTTTSGRQHKQQHPLYLCSTFPVDQKANKVPPDVTPECFTHLSWSTIPLPGKFGRTLAPSHNLSPTHLAHLHHLGHLRTDHILGELPPPPFNATLRNAPAPTPHRSDQLRPTAKAPHPNAHGNPA